MPEVLPENIEQKYRFSAPLLPMLLDWSDFSLEPDPAYADGVINSLYYDTPNLHLYHQKRASEYLKFKLRLRWYGDVGDGAHGASVPGFLEVKRKIGAIRRKQRTAVKLDGAELIRRDFASKSFEDLAAHAFENGFPECLPLHPVAHIRYRRRRYIDPVSGARIAIDWEIRCEWFNTALAPFQAPDLLDAGVLEVKGATRHLPSSLEPVSSVLHKYSFSKYAQCLEKLAYPKGVRI